MALYDEIYDKVKKIPSGKVATYGQIALMCGNLNYARAVGNALHKNQNPQEVPCHRVVNHKGMVSKSFAFGSADAQANLLRAEGVEVINGKVDLKRFAWNGII